MPHIFPQDTVLSANSSHPKHYWFWLSLSCGFSLFYAALALRQAFATDYVIQDDARQHVFWMQRFLDSQLFPHDLIANYFQAVAPKGYISLYWLPAQLGISPLVLNKFLPSLMGLVTTCYSFGAFLQILPLSVGGFMATLLLNQSMWMNDDLASATPRGFFYPLLAAFLYYLLRQRLWGVAVTLMLLSLFYPQGIFLGLGMLVLRLSQWREGRFNWTKQRQDWLLAGVGVLAAGLGLLPFLFSSSGFGPTITGAQAITMAEFGQGGRSEFFYPPAPGYFLMGRGAILTFIPPLIQWIGFLLPLFYRSLRRFPLLKMTTSQVWVLPQLLGVSVLMFSLAHLVLFRLHLPNRYTSTSFRFILAFAAAIVWLSIIDRLWQRFRQSSAKRGWVRFWLLTIICGLLSFPFWFPFWQLEFPNSGYHQGRTPELYKFLRQSPKQSLTASLEAAVNEIPSFAQRSILVGKEYAIPYHLGYYQQFRQRVIDVIQAQYSLEPEVLKQVIQKYQLTYWLIQPSSFTPEFLEHSWIRQYPEAVKTAQTQLQQGQPALQQSLAACTVFQEGELRLLDAQCLLQER